MKRIITLSVALVLGSAILLGTKSYTTASAASAGFVADTGVITLGPNQILRVTAMVPQRSQVRSLTVTFDRQVNTHGTCNASGVCVHTVASRTTTEPMTLVAGQAASIDIAQPTGGSAVRGQMLMSIDMRPDERPDVEVNAMVVDTNTGQVMFSNKLFVGGLSW